MTVKPSKPRLLNDCAKAGDTPAKIVVTASTVSRLIPKSLRTKSLSPQTSILQHLKRNYPPPRAFGSGDNGISHRVIGSDAGQTLGVYDSADVGIGVCGPVCPEAICDFPVDDGGSQGALAIIVGWLQQIWRIKGGQQLLAGVGGLAQQCAGHVAVGPSAEDFADLVLQAPPFAGDGAGRECAEMSPECEGIAHPEFEPERRRIVADLQSIGDVADQIRQTGLMALAVTLLGAITIRGAERRAMTTHHISKHLGRPTEGRLVKHTPIRAEHPVLGVDALDPHAHLITGHGGRLAQAALPMS
jgi:hypothetical protein